MKDAPRPRQQRWLLLSGLGLAGYGLLILLQILPHDAPFAGAASMVLGLLCLVAAVRQTQATRGTTSPTRRRVVNIVGAISVGGVVLYNGIRGSTMETPEWGILGYGVALLVAAPHMHRRIGNINVGTLVAWSFPLLLAPLAMYAVNAVLSADNAGTAATPIVGALVVAPTGSLLWLFGIDAQVVGNNLILAGPQGRLTLGVGLVCAGLYPMVLFGGLMGLHAWERQVSWRRLAAYLSTGLLGLWFVNLLRIVILVKVGQLWGGAWVQTVHAHIGWVLFGIFMVAYWAVVLRVVEAPGKPPKPVAA